MNSIADRSAVMYNTSPDDLSSILAEQSPLWVSKQVTTSGGYYSTPSRANCTWTGLFEEDWVLFPDAPEPSEQGTTEIELALSNLPTCSVLSDYVTEEALSLLDIDQYIRVLSEGPGGGKTKRPPNSFILYRTAFRHIAERVLSTKSQQHVSKLCGESWLQEKENIKTWFQEQAMIAKANYNKHVAGQEGDTKFWKR
ncbi:HMG-box protein STE11 [Fusarium bulbicola]|nr:HMG-box protein STE11 [Fusarium bulbicola]